MANEKRGKNTGSETKEEKSGQNLTQFNGLCIQPLKKKLANTSPLKINRNHRQKFEKCGLFFPQKLLPIWQPQANIDNILYYIIIIIKRQNWQHKSKRASVEAY
jgi:hypothetical protein